MTAYLYIVHKQTHILHRVGGCGRTIDYSLEKYQEYETVEKAFADHSPDIRSCKNCVNKKALEEIMPHI